MQALFGGSNSIFNMGPEDQSCMPNPKRRKEGLISCTVVPKDDCQEDSLGEILIVGNRWRRYDIDKIEEIPHSRSYACTNPRCSMKIHLEETPLFPGKFLIIYEGVHSHRDIPTPYVTQESTMSYVTPTGRKLSLEEVIEFMIPAYGIFLREPSQLRFWSRDYHIGNNLANSSLPQSGRDKRPDQASFPINKAVQSPLLPNGFHNPQLNLQQENNTAFYSIDPEQYFNPEMGVEHHQAAVSPLPINDNVQYLGRHDSNFGVSNGDMSFQSSADVLPNPETLQYLSSAYPNLGAATEDIYLHESLDDDLLQFNEIMQPFTTNGGIMYSHM